MKASVLTIAFLAALTTSACGSDIGQYGGGGGANPAHEQELNALPLYPGLLRDGAIVTNGAGTFASFWANSTAEVVAPFYSQELPTLGWQAAGTPTTVAGVGGEPHTLLTFTKDTFTLTLDLYDNPQKGRDRGNLHMIV